MRGNGRRLGEDAANIQGVVARPTPDAQLGRSFAEMMHETSPSAAVVDTQPPKVGAPESTALVERAIEGVLVDDDRMNVYSIGRCAYQPRIVINMERVKALAESIQSEGLANPILIRKLGTVRHEVIDGEKREVRYEVIAGERRLLAFRLLRRLEIPYRLLELSDRDAAVLALTDNEAREDLTDYERGKRYKALLDEGFVKNQTELAISVGKSGATISRCLAYFKLPNEIITMLDEQPDLLGTKVVADIVQYASDGYKDLSIDAVNKVKDGHLSQENALNWLKGEVRKLTSPRSAPLVRTINNKAGRSVADAKIEGRKVVLTCPKEVSPETLLALIERTLQDNNEDLRQPADA